MDGNLLRLLVVKELALLPLDRRPMLMEEVAALSFEKTGNLIHDIISLRDRDLLVAAEDMAGG